MNFSDVLASTVHDIKNSLGMVLNTLEELTSAPESPLANHPKAALLQLEARRANNDLIQLLTLYNFQNERLSANLMEHNLEDFLDDIVIENRSMAQARGIEISHQCDPFLNAYFDEDLVHGVLNSAIGNASRYTNNRLLITAGVEQGFTVIRIEDNGAGFPPAMLERQCSAETPTGFGSGRTRLGLVFSEQVAKIHRKGERQGFIKLENGYRLEGGCFSVWLP